MFGLVFNKKKETITLKIEDWNTARWLINCAMQAIDDSPYKRGSVRHNEMLALTADLARQCKKQMKVPDEYDS